MKQVEILRLNPSARDAEVLADYLNNGWKIEGTASGGALILVILSRDAPPVKKTAGKLVAEAVAN